MKADLAGLKAHLSKREERGEEVTTEQREEEEIKTQMWLAHRLDELARENDTRLLETEEAFNAYKASEGERLAKVNKKISVKIQILMERLGRVKRRVQALPPRSKLHAEHSSMQHGREEGGPPEGGSSGKGQEQEQELGQEQGLELTSSLPPTARSVAFTVGEEQHEHKHGAGAGAALQADCKNSPSPCCAGPPNGTGTGTLTERMLLIMPEA